MDWIKQNTFLATFGGIMLLGFLGLGFFAFSSWKGYSAAVDEFESTRTKLTSLEGAPLHPNPENVELVKTKVDEYEQAVDALFIKLKEAQPALPAEVDVTTFGKKVQAKLEPFMAKAAEREVLLGEAFYMGMDDYRTNQPPNDKEILQKLEWSLGGIAVLADLILEAGVESLDDFRRYEQPWENPAAKPAEPEKTTSSRNRRSNRSSRGRRGAPAKSPAQIAAEKMDDVLESARVRLRLTGTPDSISKFFNLVSNNEEYHFWIRWAKVGNEAASGPPRSQLFNPKPVDSDDRDEPPAEDGEVEEAEGEDVVEEERRPAMIDVFPILGTERVRADVVIDIVRFRDKPAPEKKN